MNFVSAGVLTPFEATFIDTGKSVQAWIYDMTSGSPVGPVKVTMSEVTPGTYVGTFTPDSGKTYLVVKRVFTDGTFATVDSGYAPSTETVQSESLSSGGGGSGSGCGIVAILESASITAVLEESSLVVSLDSNQLSATLGEDSLVAQLAC